MNLYLDIETIPGQAPWVREEVAKGIKPPGNMKKAETIEKWEAEQKPSVIDDAWKKTGLIGTYGEIICISWAIDDNPVKSVRRGLSGSEGILLNEFFDQVKTDLSSPRENVLPATWIGHNITGFDLRFIWQRAVVTKAKPSIIIPVNAKPWDDVIFDTFTEWAGFKSSGGGSLSAICQALGIPDEDTIDGSQVWDYVRKGDIDTVVKHCEIDVNKVRLVHKRLTFS